MSGFKRGVIAAALLSMVATGCILDEEEKDPPAPRTIYAYESYALATEGVRVTAFYEPGLRLRVTLPEVRSLPHKRFCSGLIPVTFSIDGVAGGGTVRPPLWSELRDIDGFVEYFCLPLAIQMDVPPSMVGQGKQLQLSDGTTTLTFPIDPPPVSTGSQGF